MAAAILSSRAIIGEFFRRLEQDIGAGWVTPVSMAFDSDQDSEKYNWIGQSPMMREWIGGRQAKGFSENSIDVINKHFEATIRIEIKDLRRDKTGQIFVRIADLAQRTNAHWAKLLSDLITNGASSIGYDGQFFFDTDHTEGKNTTNQSNSISTDISALPVSVNGTATAPSVEEAQQVITNSVAQMMGFLDDQSEPMNENARTFLVMVPVSLYSVFAKAVSLPHGTAVTEQNIPNEMMVSVVANARLTTTDSIYTFRTDGFVKPFIRQTETPVQINALAEDSEYAFTNKSYQFGVDTWRNVQYGYWQHAVLNQMV